MPQPHAANPAQLGHENDYAEYASTPYDHDQYTHTQGYGHQQSGGYDARSAYNNGYAEDYQHSTYDRPQVSLDRAYDPRFQPRAQKGPPPGHGQPPVHRGPPPQSQQPYQANARQNGHAHQRPRDARGRSNGAPDQGSMAEWKAREKAKFQKQAQAPESLPLDNAFPVFPNKRNESSMDRSGGASSRASGDRSRPQTSGGSRPRENSHNTAPPARPEYQRATSDERGYGRQNGAPQYGHGHDSHEQQQQPYHAGPPVTEQYPAQWPMVDDRMPPRQDRSNGAGRDYAPDQRAQQQQQRHGPQRGGVPPQPIDTRTSERHAYMDRRPPPEAAVPRPATSHAQATSPTRHYPQDPRPWVQQGPASDSGHESLGDIYDDYGADNSMSDPQPGHLKRAPTTRDEEIEAEMPDFDSAAPGQTSRLQKKAAPPPINSLATATPPPISSARSAPPGVQVNGYGQRPMYDQSSRSTPGPGPLRGGGPRGFAEPHGDNKTPVPGSQQGYDLPYRGPHRQDLGQGQGGPMQPPRAPFAHEPPARRSLDDARQGPRRPGPGQHPPPQRFDQYGRPIRPPQGRPDMDRSATWADSRQARGPGPPPPAHQQGMRGPPNGAPLTQQRSNPQPGGNGYNPDALPQHPVPVRPGLMDQGEPQAVKPPPVRSYNAAGPITPATLGPNPPQNAHDRQASIDRFAQPVTLAEIEQLRSAVDSTNSPKQGLILVKKLIEAAAVLATEGGRADQKTTAKNRERYITEAYKRLKKLVSNGYPDAQFYLADCYGQGMLGLEVDTKEAFKLYQAAAKAGHAQAAYRTAVCCEMGPEDGGGTSRDYPKAVQWYRRAAALGDAAAMYKLGAILLKSLLGQPKNIAEAVTWLKRGAERADADHPHALHELAGLYESSNANPEIRNKVIADDAYARELFKQAAGLGYKFSQFRLGQAYEYGALGLPIDNRTSISWYTKAAAQGEHQAELALSGWYLTGAEGILEHSETEAYLWARKAAASEPPLPKAMFAMGYFTEQGIGCPASMEEARKWYGRAASHKFPKAIERLEELRKGGGKSGKTAPAHGKLSRKEGKRDQKKDEENCSVM